MTVSQSFGERAPARGRTWWALTGVLAAGVWVGALVSEPAVAQASAASTAAQTAQPSLQEVVVTAERRETDLQKTPVAVTAVTQETLVRAGVNTLTNLQKVAPDVQFIAQSGGGTDQAMVRGVQSTDASPTSEDAVAVYVDGAVLAKQPGLEGFLFDIQRVEVDKGPQGTLFGRNTNGGAVQIITNKPQLGRMSGEGEFEAGSYNTIRTSGYINLPLGDSFALRGAFMTFSHNGYMKSGLNDANLHSGRLSGLWRANSRDTLTVILDSSRDFPYDDTPVANMVRVMPGINNVYVPTDPRDDTFYNGHAASPNSPFRVNVLVQGITAQNDYEMNTATWSTIFNHRTMNRNPQIGPNNIGQGPLVLAPNGIMAHTAARNYVPQQYSSYSLETRLTSKATAPLQWIVGLYGFREHDSGTMIGFGDQTTTVPSIEIANPYETDRTFAAYGQIVYTPGNGPFHITLGARANEDLKLVRNIYTRFGTTPYPYNALIAEKSHTWRAGTYRAELSYDVAANSLLYADTATGFKAGGYGYGPGIDPAQGPIYGPERITAYEFGSKNRFLHQTLQLNLEGWIYKYTGFTTGFAEFGCDMSVSPPKCGGLPVLTTASAGEATYRGATIDLQWLFTPNDRFTLDFSRLYAEYGSYIQQAAPGYSLAASGYVPVTSSLTNTPIPQVPHATGTASYTHTWQGVLGGSINAEIDGQYRGRDMLGRTIDPLYGTVIVEDDAWFMGDLSLQYQHGSGDWNVTIYDHNFTNGLHPTTQSESSATHAISGGWLPPRVIGAILQVYLQ